MKKMFLFMVAMILVLVGCDNQEGTANYFEEDATIYPAVEEPTKQWPMLFISTRWYDQRKAIQGVTNWTVFDEEGVASTTMTDSPHPLQISSGGFWPEATISMRTARTEIEFHFNTPPQSVSIVRWNESNVENLGTQAAGEAAGYYEPVEANENGITIVDDGYVYIYQVRADWEEGFSYFAFRVIPLPTPTVDEYDTVELEMSENIQEESYVLRGVVLEYEPFYSDGSDGNIAFVQFMKIEGIHEFAGNNYIIRRFEDIPILDAQGNPISEYDIALGSIVDIWHVGRMTASLPRIAHATKVQMVQEPISQVVQNADLMYFYAEVLEFDPAYDDRNHDAALFVRGVTSVEYHPVGNRYFLMGENITTSSTIGNAISINEILPGTQVRVEAYAFVKESDPAIIPSVVSVQIVDV